MSKPAPISAPLLNDAALARVLKALAAPKRLRMMREIAAAGELSCGELGRLFDVSQPTISHHLKLLTDSGLLHVREAGQHRIISVNHRLVANVAALLPMRLPAPARRAGKTPRAGQRGARG